MKNKVLYLVLLSVLFSATNVFAYGKDTKTYGAKAVIESNVKYLKKSVEQQKEIISLLKEIKKDSHQKEMINLLKDIRRILNEK